ncbi:hypothetical protein D9M68_485240 [compost metagenome]
MAYTVNGSMSRSGIELRAAINPLSARPLGAKAHVIARHDDDGGHSRGPTATAYRMCPGLPELRLQTKIISQRMRADEVGDSCLAAGVQPR